jgi:hypothetical protein
VPRLVGHALRSDFRGEAKYSPLSLSDVFTVDGKRIGVVHIIVWVAVCVLVLLMLADAVGEARA